MLTSFFLGDELFCLFSSNIPCKVLRPPQNILLVSFVCLFANASFAQFGKKR